MQQRTTNYWDEIYQKGVDFSLISSASLSRALEGLPSGAPLNCLDIGCGTGQLTRELYHRGYRAVGIDASENAIRIARSLTTAPSEKLSYVLFDIERDELSDLPDAPYGLITCKLVYAFIKDKPAFLKRVNELLAPQGTFVVITPLPEDTPPDKQHIAVPYEKTLQELRTVFPHVDTYREQSLTYFRAWRS